MPSASYYREQARLLLEWAQSRTDPEVVMRLEARAQYYLVLADAAEIEYPKPDDRLSEAIGAFNERQMTPEAAPVIQQQQQIQPKKED